MTNCALRVIRRSLLSVGENLVRLFDEVELYRRRCITRSVWVVQLDCIAIGCLNLQMARITMKPEKRVKILTHLLTRC